MGSAIDAWLGASKGSYGSGNSSPSPSTSAVASWVNTPKTYSKPINVGAIKDVPTLNKALKSGAINQNQWMARFKQLQPKINGVNTPKAYSVGNTFGALSHAINSVLVQPTVQSFTIPAKGIARVLPGGMNDIKAQSQAANQGALDTSKIIQLQKSGKISKSAASRLLTANAANTAEGNAALRQTISELPSKTQLALGFGSLAALTLTAGKGIVGSRVNAALGGDKAINKLVDTQRALQATKTATLADRLGTASVKEAKTTRIPVVSPTGTTAARKSIGNVAVTNADRTSIPVKGVSTQVMGKISKADDATYIKKSNQLSKQYEKESAKLANIPSPRAQQILQAKIDAKYEELQRQLDEQAGKTSVAFTGKAKTLSDTLNAIHPRSAFHNQPVIYNLEAPATIKTAEKTIPVNIDSKNVPLASKELPKAESVTALPSERKLSRNLISVSGELSRQGKSGKEIANRLGKAESASEIGQAQFLQKIPSVVKLKGQKFGEFVDTLGQLSKAKGAANEKKILDSARPEVQQAVSEWSKAIPLVRQRAKAAGVEVGDLGKYYFPRNYTKLLSTKDGLTRAANQLVKSGQATDLGDAISKLRFMKNEYNTPFGHFERSRTLDLPEYDKTKNALVNYVSGAFNKIGHAEQFGPKGEIASKLIGNIGQEGHDAERAQRNYQIATGTYKYHNPGVDTVLSKVRGYNRVTKLGLSSILNATQSTNTAAVAGVLRTAKAAFKQLSPAERAYIDQTGVRIDSVINALREQTGAASTLSKSTNAFKKGLGKIINAPGFGQVERFNRGVAAVAGRDWADSLAAKGTPRSIAILRDKLGIEGDIGKRLTPAQQVQASRKVVELTQFKTGAKDLPGWADSPMGKTVAQFRTFSYKQTGFLYNELIKEAVKNHNILPLLRFVAVGTPTGLAAGGVRNKLGGKPFYGNNSKGQSDFKKYLTATYQGSSNVGGTGLAGSVLFLAQNAKSPNEPSYVAGDVGGPTIGLGASIIQARSQGKVGEKRLAFGQVPVAGPYLKSKLTPYGSQQSRSLDQVMDEKTAKVLVKANDYQPKDPTDSRSKELKKANPEKYQQYLDTSNKRFIDAVKKAQSDPRFKSKSPKDQKATLSYNLSQARQKTLNDFHISKPRKTTAKKRTSYVR